MSGLRALSPAYFALVMSTGIVSLAAHMLDHNVLAHALFVLNILFYVVLWVLFALRIAWYRHDFLRDITDHLRAPGFFTVVVGTSVLGSQSLLLAGNLTVALALWWFAAALWVAATYTIFAIFTVKRIKPPLQYGINGGWLLAVVATQSIAVLGALLAADIGQPWKMEVGS